jgi:hypothetical protein
MEATVRYIIECDDPTDIILGMKAIRWIIRDGNKDAIIGFEDNSVWYVKKTKTGYSARSANNGGRNE